jgi:hypothetical protein
VEGLEVLRIENIGANSRIHSVATSFMLGYVQHIFNSKSDGWGGGLTHSKSFSQRVLMNFSRHDAHSSAMRKSIAKGRKRNSLSLLLALSLTLSLTATGQSTRTYVVDRDTTS